jgi:hypothetical protein
MHQHKNCPCIDTLYRSIGVTIVSALNWILGYTYNLWPVNLRVQKNEVLHHRLDNEKSRLDKAYNVEKIGVSCVRTTESFQWFPLPKSHVRLMKKTEGWKSCDIVPLRAKSITYIQYIVRASQTSFLFEYLSKCWYFSSLKGIVSRDGGWGLGVVD